MITTLLELFENNDIQEKLLVYLRNARYNNVIQEYKEECFKKSHLIRAYKSARRNIHPARFFISDKPSNMIDVLFKNKYYIFGIELSHNAIYNYNGIHYNNKHGFHYNLYSADDCFRFTKRMEKFCYKNGIIEKLLNRSNQNIILGCRYLENYNPKILKTKIKENLKKSENHIGRFLIELENDCLNDKKYNFNSVIDHYLINHNLIKTF